MPLVQWQSATTTPGGTVPKLFAERDLLLLLDRLKLEHDKRAPLQPSYFCVCPLFLDLLANMTLLYDQQAAHWLVMHQPRVYRNNSLTEEIAFEAEFAHDAAFYAKNSWLQQLRPALRETIVHREACVVEYNESPPALSPLEEASLVDLETPLKQINKRLRKLGRFSQLALQRQSDAGRRVKKQLTGEAVMCYVYCDQMNKQFLPPQ
jgi:hypothetical protein